MNRDYLTKQDPLSALTKLAMPMILGYLFQQMYNMTDTAIVGRLVGEQALAAVGASYAMTNIFICVANGGGIGASVIVGRHFGAGSYRDVKTAVSTALRMFLAVSIVLGIIGVAISRPVMAALNTPPDTLSMAVTYLQIYFAGLPFLFMYSVISAMFNAIGQSRKPLYFLIFSSVLNVALDLAAVGWLGLGIAGAAWATLTAQGLAAVLSWVSFRRVIRALPGGEGERFNGREMRSMVRLAIPSILQLSSVALGMMLVQSVVNSFGSETLAGFSAALRVEYFVTVPVTALGNALSSYTAQNMGANRPDRVRRGFRIFVWTALACSAGVWVILEVWHREIITLFLGSGASEIALDTGSRYLAFLGWSSVVCALKLSADGVLRGAGCMKPFVIANLANLGIRVAAAVMLAPSFGVQTVWQSVPLGWAANLLISYLAYRSGRWQRALPRET